MILSRMAAQLLEVAFLHTREVQVSGLAGAVPDLGVARQGRDLMRPLATMAARRFKCGAEMIP